MSVPSLHRESTDSRIPGKDIMVDPTLMSGIGIMHVDLLSLYNTNKLYTAREGKMR